MYREPVRVTALRINPGAARRDDSVHSGDACITNDWGVEGGRERFNATMIKRVSRVSAGHSS